MQDVHFVTHLLDGHKMTEPLTRTMANAVNQINDKVKYAGKKLCVKCGNYYHPDNYEMCWNCWSEQLPETTEPYASMKDATEGEENVVKQI
jgi:uncharacterized OB-fold protein